MLVKMETGSGGGGSTKSFVTYVYGATLTKPTGAGASGICFQAYDADTDTYSGKNIFHDVAASGTFDCSIATFQHITGQNYNVTFKKDVTMYSGTYEQQHITAGTTYTNKPLYVFVTGDKFYGYTFMED